MPPTLNNVPRTARATARRGRGRPTKLDQVVHVRNDGTPVTCAERFCEHLAAGNYFETAAGLVGISKETAYHWVRTGANVNMKLYATDPTPRSEFTRFELMCSEFSDAVDRATAEAEARDVTAASLLAAGGLKLQTVTEKRDHDGELLESTTRTEYTAPDGAMLRWRLERRFGQRWGREALELTGPGGGPIELSIDDKRADLLEILDTLGTGLVANSGRPALNAVSIPLPEAGGFTDSDG